MIAGFDVEIESATLPGAGAPGRPAVATVTQRVGSQSAFSLRWPVSASMFSLTPLDSTGIGPDDVIRVVDGSGGSLVRGVVREHRAHIEHGPVNSWLDAKGVDRSAEMQRVEQFRVHNGSVTSILEGVLGEYFESASVDQVAFEHTADVNDLVQAEDDYAFVRRVCGAWGLAFDVRAGEGEQARVWRPTLGTASATLRINLDNPTVDAVDLAWDVNRPTRLDAAQVSWADKSVWGEEPAPAAVELPAIPGQPRPLSEVASERTRGVGWAVSDGAELDARRDAVLAAERWFVSMSCTTTARRLGTVVHAGDTVAVEGLGPQYDGDWLIWEVEHVLDSVGHTMRLQVVRDTFGGGGLV